MKVIKRDGREKEFDGARIFTAIKAAYVDVYGSQPFIRQREGGYITIPLMIANQLECDIRNLHKNTISVEEIQDMVVAKLYEEDKQVAEAYSEYRQQRTIERENKAELVKDIMSLIENENLELITENSNKQSQLISTQRDLMAGEVSKHISRLKIVPKHLMKAHDKGIIKIHDLDYLANPSTNCELVNIKDMLWNGTVINKKMIERPKSLRTAMTIVTQIAAQVASNTYGGQTISLSHIAPFVRISKEKIKKKYYDMNLPVSELYLEYLIDKELRDEIRDSVQTFNYQISTLMTTNGQAPFVSVCMYLNEDPEYIEETAMLCKEFFIQRINGMKNEYGVAATQTFPKLLYFLDENNVYEDSEYYWLTVLAAESTARRMNPDIISVKKMKEVIGYAFPPMGCRAFLSPFEIDGVPTFYGRGNIGACSINLPYVALASDKDPMKFWALLDESLELARQVGELRYNKLKGVKASVAPILWQHGAIARLNADDDITKAIDERGFTVSIGYSGIYETVKYMTGHSHVDPTGYVFAELIMSHLKQYCLDAKEKQPHLRFALYGTPAESTTGWFHDKLKKEFGVVKDITDKGYITNSYHIDVREEIDAFRKLDLESGLQRYSTGGAVSYVEVHNLQDNIPAVLELYKHMYETIIYSEINFESDVCGKCHYTGTMENDPETLEWYCPVCGNKDQSKLSVVRRTCGYLGETIWTDARKKDILNRVKHL